MRRVIAIAITGYSLAGCSSFASLMPSNQRRRRCKYSSIQCRQAPMRGRRWGRLQDPCAVAVSAPDSGFSVAYTLNKFQPATVPVQVIRIPGDFASPGSTTVDPNPVVAELQPAAPPPRAAGKKILTPKKPNRPRPPRPLRERRSRRQRPPRPPAKCLHCSRKVRIVCAAHHAYIAIARNRPRHPFRPIHHGGCHSNKAH